MDINNSSENTDLSLKDFILKIQKFKSFVFSKWKILLMAGMLGGTIGLIFGLLEKPEYKASLTFAMEEEKGSGGLGGALSLASSFGIDLGGSGGGGAFAVSNLTELMKSRLILEKVLFNSILIDNKKQTLIEYYITVNKFKEGWDATPDLKNLIFNEETDLNNLNRQQDSILKNIYKGLVANITIQPKDKKVTIINIEVINEDEKFAKLFCENIAKETSDFYVQTKSKKARNNLEILQKQVDSIRHELNSSINGVAVQTDNVYNLNPAFNIKGTPSKRKQIDVQANSAILTNLVVQLELSKITVRKETPLIQLIDSPKFPLDKIKFGKLKAIILGGLIMSFIFLFYILGVKLYNKIMA
jgi:uncharacterized protein involved in exopolysaccharide biosynthesis